MRKKKSRKSSHRSSNHSWIGSNSKQQVLFGTVKIAILDILVSIIHGIVSVVISNRLVSSPCAIVAEVGGYTANVEKLLSGCIV
jgi:hypothetical protein